MDQGPQQQEHTGEGPAAPDAIARFRRWAAAAVALAAIGYLAYAIWKGIEATASELASFSWPLYVPVLALTCVNYGMRYGKWHLLLRWLGIEIPHRTNAWIFLAGLAMVISPGKAGELVKPYLAQVCAGAPMLRTIPALAVERATDGLAVVILAAIGVSTYFAEAKSLIFGTIAASAAAVVAISVRPVAIFGLRILDGIGLHKLSARLLTLYDATATCLRPIPLLVTMTMSMIAWFAECIGYWLVLVGIHGGGTLGQATFLYAFATVFGAPSPGGMGISDAALVEGAVTLVQGITAPQALAASLLIRIATLWFGVLIGAFALLRMEQVITDARRTSP